MGHLPVPTVVKMTMADLEGGGGQCSAFKVGADLIGTAGHCCDEGSLYTVGETGIEATALVDDDENDVCILRAMVPGAPIRLAAHDPAIGEPVYTYGFPSGTPVLSSGYWSGREDGLGIASVVGRGGASGSPVLNFRDEAVGVLVAGYRNGDSIVFISTVEHLRYAVAVAKTR